MDKIKNKKHVSIIFDGTTSVYEAMLIVVHYITDDWVIQQLIINTFLSFLMGQQVPAKPWSLLSTT